MTRSKLRKIRRLESKRSKLLFHGAPLAGAILAATGVAQAQQADEERGLDEVVVTALKTQQNLQDVPLSMQAIGTERLEQLGVSGFEDYVKFLPSVSFQQAGPGFARVFMRGAASGDNGNHSGPQPSVGQYLDEQPITTIQGALDIHMYDIARVEALAGPQGTLYGASSQAGTIRIITNKPDKSGFDAAYSLQGSSVTDGDVGYLAEGFVNVPIGESAAIRLVGWARHDAGYIDNVAATRTFPTSGISMSSRAEDDYNDADTIGARAALKIDLNDNWTLTPTIMGQQQKSNGIYAQESGFGELQVAHWHPENSDDRWMQAAMTLEGKLSTFDMTFTTSYLKRDVDVNSDYSDYSFFYDTLNGSGQWFYDNDGDLINPSQYIRGKDGYTKASHELRFSTDPEKRTRFVGGLFYQRQTHDIQQDYRVDGYTDEGNVTGWDDTLWLTKQWRVDRDYAVFGELSFDITDRFTLMGGFRQFKYENSLEGFYGFGITNTLGSSTGEASCEDTGHVFSTAPCTNLDRTVKDDDHIFKFNATFHATDDAMFYATYSEGFRPGGVNRRGSFPPYGADFLTNYEIGWKTSWLGNRLRFNGAVYKEVWDDFQFSFLGENGLTNVANANGAADLRGIEMDLQWAAAEGLTIYGGLALQESEMQGTFCKLLGTDGRQLEEAECLDDDGLPTPFAPSGTSLPTTPKFKANIVARKEFKLGGYDSHLQGSVVHNSTARSALLPAESAILGDQDGYSIFDFSFGLAKESWEAELFINNVFDDRASLYRYVECDTKICGPIVYSVVNRPRTIGLKFSQKF
ncbi:MAG TPA: TonB-dependent receptor [Steroidobacteraceae bacterium]|nr:TonB-dependent receptor [Steroidobacteraceae bacterium]